MHISRSPILQKGVEYACLSCGKLWQFYFFIGARFAYVFLFSFLFILILFSNTKQFKHTPPEGDIYCPSNPTTVKKSLKVKRAVILLL